tara:strand:- start:435 stop:620 length:186 start_codon:yes stop_codon:yes gene_type:complete
MMTSTGSRMRRRYKKGKRVKAVRWTNDVKGKVRRTQVWTRLTQNTADRLNKITGKVTTEEE